jgi:uncharacterized integral membrane protein (TIGR00697 family)
MNDTTQSRQNRPEIDTRIISLIGLFVTALITAQLTAAKVISLELPVSFPLVGSALIFPGAALAYAVTYIASDCLGELHGRHAAHKLVGVGFVMNFVMLGLLWTTLKAPSVNPAFGSTFNAALTPTTSIVVGSLVAYLVSQNTDVYLFHKIKEATDGDHLWLRNITSTAVSQAVDTVIFISMAFVIVPQLLNTGNQLPMQAIIGLVLGQYLLKFLIALVDTPIVYIIVETARNGQNKKMTPLAGAD